MTAPNVAAAGAARPFSDRVVILFVTQVATAAIGIFNGFVLARLLGPSAKGDYYLLTLLPITIMVAIQLGLPSAVGYYAARGDLRGLTRKSVVLTLAVTVPALVVTAAVLPALRGSILAGLDPILIAIALIALPIQLNATITTGTILGRQAVRWYAITSVGQALTYSVLLVIFVAWLGLGVPGAIAVFVIVAAVQAGSFFVGSARLTAHATNPKETPIRDLFRFGIPLHPGNVTLFFAYRADVFLLAALLADPSAPLGYYSMGVSMAEMVFFFPNAVSVLFFPHVAGSAREEADRQVPMVSRVTLLMTAAFGLALIPVATVLISVIVPAFTPALPALYILLPGVVALSVSKVLTGYLTGLGRTGLTSGVSISTFVLNVILNVFLIPRFGILGAALASLVSYAASSLALSLIAGRLARTSPLAFWVTRSSDIRYAIDTIATIARRLRSAAASG
jgi:O-antigen/teichoic acid export membrane protein